jgi:hypothetical protein
MKCEREDPFDQIINEVIRQQPLPLLADHPFAFAWFMSASGVPNTILPLALS